MTNPERYTVTVSDLHYIKEHTPVGDYFTIDPNKAGVWFHDVISKQPLKDTGTPPSILRQPDLKAGIDFLGQLGAENKLTIQLVLGSHGNAADFADILAHNSHILDKAPIIALEISSRVEDNAGPVLRYGVVPQLSEHPGRRDFQMAQMRWAYANHKIILPSELMVNGDSELDHSLAHLWNEVYTPIGLNKTYTPSVKNAAGFIAERAYQRTRQPAILARLGQLLQKMDREGQLPQEPLKIPLVIGSWHAKSADRLRAMGVAVETYTSQTIYDTDTKWTAFGQVAMEATYSGYASIDDLGMALPY